LDDVRAAALNHMDRRDRRRVMYMAVLAVMEGAFLIAYVLLADFTNRVHVLLLLAAVMVYSLLGIGLFALGSHVSHNTRLVLKALELRDRERA
jgi:hypothetical protein